MAAPDPVEAKSKFFTLEEANKTLPLVKVIVADIVRQFEVVNSQKQRLVSLKNQRRGPQGVSAAAAEETAQSQTQLEVEEAQLIAYIEELTRLGIELKGPDGLCDFPSLRDGREIYLCWRLGEPTVRFWHEINAGFAGRQPLELTSKTENRLA